MWYTYNKGLLRRETYGDTVLDFFYDANGTPYSMLQNRGAMYYYITNLQGDVIRLVNSSGQTAAYYEYDPYGNAITAAGSHCEINPLRYRGYVYDTETGLYYCQSRYYDPEIGRFINADEYASTGQSIIGYNMFAYCNNNPINCVDVSGTRCVPLSRDLLASDVAEDNNQVDPVSYSGTVSLGAAVSVNVGPWVYGVQAFFTVDAKSQIALQYGVFSGISAGPDSDKISAAITPFAMATNAPNCEALNGPGLQMGVSIPSYVVDYVAVLDTSGEKVLYNGILIGGLATAPDFHVTGGNTWSLAVVPFDWEVYNQVTQY